MFAKMPRSYNLKAMSNGWGLAVAGVAHKISRKTGLLIKSGLGDRS